MVVTKEISTEVNSGLNAKIVDGYEVKGNFPFMVSLRYGPTRYHACGGTIISSIVILTAAHCIYEEDPVSVTYGCNSLDGDLVSNEIQSTKYHQYFEPDTLLNDVAVLFLQNTIIFGDRVNPVVFSRIKKLNQPVRVIGWGTVDSKDESALPRELRIVPMEAIYFNNCKQQMPREVKEMVRSSMVCTRGRTGKGDCQGDSGGPLLDLQNKQVGIVSWGISCGTHIPNVYTRVASYVKWINKVTGLNLNLQ